MITTYTNGTQKPNQNGILNSIFLLVIAGMMVVQEVSCFQTTLTKACRGGNTFPQSRLISAAREFQLPLFPVEATRSAIDTLESKARTAIAGKISFFLSKLVVNKTKLQKIATSLEIHIDPREVAALIVLSFFSVPAAHLLFKVLGSSSANAEQNVKGKFEDDGSDTESSDFFQENSDTSPWGDLIRWIAPSRHIRNKYFYKSLIFQTADHISQISKLGTIVYAFDLCLIFLTDLGFSVTTHLHHIFPKTLYTVWLAGRLKQFKKYMLKRSFGNNSTQIYLYDRIINLVIYVTTVTILLEVYSIEWGVALSSLFAFGGLSTFLFGLASKDLVSQLVNSIALTASNNFHEGESIIIGDGTKGVKGVVVKLGWLHTLIRGDDEAILKIPNSHLVNQRVCNLSRVRRCQVKQTIRFKYSDMDKIPDFITSLKEEMKMKFSATLITKDRPFRVHFRDIEADHLEVVCDFRFNLPPTGDAYYDNRQKVIETIAKVVKDKGMNFA